MDVFLGNPAGRLYRFLDHCQKENPNDSILNGWRRYLDLDPSKSPTEVLSGMSPLFVLPGTVMKRLQNLPDAEAHLEDYSHSLFAASLALDCAAQANSRMEILQANFDSGDVTALRLCSRVLEKDSRSAVATDAQLSDVRGSAVELIDAINAASDLPAEVRETLLGYAHAAVRDIDRYNVVGVEALIAGSDRLRGQAYRDPGLVSATVAEKSVWQAVVRFSEALLVVASLVHSPLAISSDVQKYQAELGASIPTIVVAPVDSSTDAATPPK